MVKKGFTLAEVLITLGIIGVVAAMTIPTLMSNTDKKDIVVKVKKIYSTLSQNTTKVNYECSGKLLDCLTDPNNASTTEDELYALYKSKFTLLKECDIEESGCFADDSSYVALNGDEISGDNFNHKKMVFNDGTALLFAPNTDMGLEIYIIVDINGPKKPNRYGKDTFNFYYNQDRNLLEPYGQALNGIDCNKSNSGYDCAAKIITDDKITYF